ncbi:cell division control protein 48 homolog E-like [Brassica napus]|uniref:cell division control protein 48 homolog E-like n=1 Tax=Brassica napus TaxID=3708 RepID=UPI0006AB204F|nr:cell division control protein 48 homolog E-like [Brassica napus]
MSNQPESSDFKNDFNSAILERKKSPNRFVVDEAIDDDNSSFSLHHSTMEKAAAFPGDAILIKAKKRKDIVFILFADESCEDPKIRMNKIVRSNLRVRLGDVILSSLLTNALTSSTESVCTRLHGYVGLVPSHVPGSARARVLLETSPIRLE